MMNKRQEKMEKENKSPFFIKTKKNMQQKIKFYGNSRYNLIISTHPFDFFKKKSENETESYFKRVRRNLIPKKNQQINSYYLFQNLKNN